ncbi:MAG: hypothetical protein ACLFNK_04910, partial [Candidatus Woesearchaeota archaeon]
MRFMESARTCSNRRKAEHHGCLIVSITAVFLFFLISSSYVTASSELVYDTDYATGDSFVVYGSEYNVSVSSDGEVILIDGPINEVIDKGDCLSSTFLKICFTGSEYDTSSEEYYADLEVHTLSPDITFTQESSSPELHPGETLYLNVTLYNEGDAPADDIHFVQEIPDGMAADTIGEDMSYSDGEINWSSSSLEEDDDVTLTYSLMAESEFSGDIQQYVEYHDGYETQREFSDGVPVTVDLPYKLTLSANATEDIYLGDLITLTASIENTASSDVTVDPLMLELPSKMRLQERDSRLESADDGLTYSGTISGDDDESFDIVARVVSEGFSEPVLSAALMSGDLAFELSDDIDLEAEIPETGLELRIWEETDEGRVFNVIDDNLEVEGSVIRRLDVYMDNPYKEAIDDVLFTIESDHLNHSNSVVSFPGDSTGRIFRENISFPMVNSSFNDEVELTVSYQTSFGYNHSDTEKFRFTYLPLDQIEIDHSLSETRPESGETVTLSVAAKNPRASDLSDITFSDIIPEGLFKSGTRERTTDIEADEERSIYDYVIKLPITSKEEEIDIATRVIYSDSLGDHDYEVPFTFTVYPREPDMAISRTVDRDEVPMGRRNKVDYVIENDEDYRFEDVILRLTGGDGIYYVGEVEKDVGSLNPGRSATLEAGENFIAFDEDASMGIPWIEFTDDQGVRHREEAPSISPRVVEEDTDLPELSIKVNDVVAVSEDSFNYTITLKNHGENDVDAVLVDGSDETEVDLLSGEDTVFRRQKDFNDYDEHMILPAPYVRFEHDDDVLFAVADDTELEAAEQDSTSNTTSENEDEDDDDSEEDDDDDDDDDDSEDDG